jgi:hypothetical protein
VIALFGCGLAGAKIRGFRTGCYGSSVRYDHLPVGHRAVISFSLAIHEIFLKGNVREPDIFQQPTDFFRAFMIGCKIMSGKVYLPHA